MTKQNRIGVLGLDTSHSVAFTDHLEKHYPEFRLVTAWPGGSEGIPVSRDRLRGFVRQMLDRGVSILDSPESVAEQSDTLLILNLDGASHRELFERVARPGLRIFIDKPMADRVADAEAIFRLADEIGAPLFSASALRFVSPLKTLLADVEGALQLRLSAPLDEKEGVPRYHFYGIHATELMVEALGEDWTTVEPRDAGGLKFRVGWSAGHRVDLSFRNDAVPFALTVRSRRQERNCADLLAVDQPIYAPLLQRIIHFIKTGQSPVTPESTLSALRLLERLGS